MPETQNPPSGEIYRFTRHGIEFECETHELVLPIRVPAQGDTDGVDPMEPIVTWHVCIAGRDTGVRIRWSPSDVSAPSNREWFETRVLLALNLP